MEEIWKDIEGSNGVYQVSNLGRVRTKDRLRWCGKSYGKIKGIILKPWKQGRKGREYLAVGVCGKHIQIQRLVAQAFIPNPNNLPCVNHKDENPKNNRVDNLEWCTYKYNNEYGTARERSQNTRREKGLMKPVVYKNLVTGETIDFDSVTSAAKHFGFRKTNVSDHCNHPNRNNKIHSFRFKNI